MLTKHSLYCHSFGAPMVIRNKQISSVLVKNTLYASSFTSGTDGWVATSNATLSNVYGNIRATVTALNAGMQKTFSTEAGKTYRIRFKVNLRGWPYMYVKDVASSTNLISITDFMTPGDYSYTFTATGYQTNVIFHEAGNASGSVQLASFILEEVEAENGYRFGFNGKENDDEVEGQQDYGFRIYDKRLGRFKSIDPLTKSYPELSTYQFANNKPIESIDLDGLEDWSSKNGRQALDAQGKPLVGPLAPNIVQQNQIHIKSELSKKMDKLPQAHIAAKEKTPAISFTSGADVGLKGAAEFRIFGVGIGGSLGLSKPLFSSTFTEQGASNSLGGPFKLGGSYTFANINSSSSINTDKKLSSSLSLGIVSASANNKEPEIESSTEIFSFKFGAFVTANFSLSLKNRFHDNSAPPSPTITGFAPVDNVYVRSSKIDFKQPEQTIIKAAEGN